LRSERGPSLGIDHDVASGVPLPMPPTFIDVDVLVPSPAQPRRDERLSLLLDDLGIDGAQKAVPGRPPHWRQRNWYLFRRPLRQHAAG
jgi:hypothetical protein